MTAAQHTPVVHGLSLTDPRCAEVLNALPGLSDPVPSAAAQHTPGLLELLSVARSVAAIGEHPPMPASDGPCLCSRCELVREARAAVATNARAAEPKVATTQLEKYIALAERCGAEVGRHEGEMVWMKFHRPSSVEAFVTGITMLSAAAQHRVVFTKEQRQDLLSAALYISARDDDSAVLTSKDAERIVELLCRLSGYEHLLEEVPDSLAASGKESA